MQQQNEILKKMYERTLIFKLNESISHDIDTWITYYQFKY